MAWVRVRTTGWDCDIQMRAVNYQVHEQEYHCVHLGDWNVFPFVSTFHREVDRDANNVSNRDEQTSHFSELSSWLLELENNFSLGFILNITILNSSTLLYLSLDIQLRNAKVQFYISMIYCSPLDTFIPVYAQINIVVSFPQVFLTIIF